MRRLALAVIAVLGLLVVPTAAHADPSAAPSIPVPSPVPGQAGCTVDSRLSGLTGLVTTANGYAVVDRANGQGLALSVYLLNNSCQRNGNPLTYKGSAAGGARDPRDLAVSADGSTFWVADTGDAANRPTVAVWKLSADGKSGSIYRFSYPQGDVHDADAMLLDGDGTPILISRVTSGPSGIYKPSAALDANKTVPLQKVGEFTPQDTGADNKFGPTGRLLVTGGANAPDGKHVVLRTYTDAYEWSVPDGNVVKAITTTTPVITPLPGESQGEAIAYTRDGKSFVTVPGQDSGVKLLTYKPAAPPAAPTKSASVSNAGANSAKGGSGSFLSKLTLQQLTYFVGAIGLIGLVMVIGGVLGIRAGRRRPQAVTAKRTRSGDRWPDDGEPATMPAGGYDPRYPQDARYDQDPYAAAEYPPGRGGEYKGGTYSSSSSSGYDSGGGGYDANRGYDANEAYSDGSYDASPGVYGGQQGGRTYRAGRGGHETGHYEDGDRGGPHSRGGQQDDPYGAPGGQSGWAPPPAAVPNQPTPRDPGRDNGIARSHRTGRPAKARGTASPKGGYSEEHEGFDDLRRLTEE